MKRGGASCEELWRLCIAGAPRIRKMADGDDDDGSAALAAMRERLAALTQPAGGGGMGGMGQALEVAA